MTHEYWYTIKEKAKQKQNKKKSLNEFKYDNLFEILYCG